MSTTVDPTGELTAFAYRPLPPPLLDISINHFERNLFLALAGDRLIYLFNLLLVGGHLSIFYIRSLSENSFLYFQTIT